MKQKLLSLVIASAVAAPAMALDEATILQRLEQLEQQRAADQAQIKALQNEIQSLKGNAGTSLQSGEAQQLQQQIVKSEEKSARRLASLKRKLEQDQEKLKINGYISAYAVKSNVDGVDLGRGVDDDWGFRPDTKVGLQFDYKLDDNIDAVVQLLAKGENDFDIEAEWAFLRWRATDNLTVRGGRMRLPFYMYSESIDVGYTYPWVRPPVEIYSKDLTAYEGIDAVYSFNMLGFKAELQPYAGSIDFAQGNTNFEVDEALGLAATFTRGPWTVRGNYSYFDETTLSISLLPDFEDTLKYMSVAARFDNGSLFAMVEASDVDVGTGLPIVGSKGFNATLGYQFGSVMPYLSYAQAKSSSDHEKQLTAYPLFGLGAIEQESYTIGVRYNATSQVVLKAEAAMYDEFNGTLGAPALGADASTRQKLDDDGVTVMSVGFDAVF